MIEHRCNCAIIGCLWTRDAEKVCCRPPCNLVVFRGCGGHRRLLGGADLHARADRCAAAAAPPPLRDPDAAAGFPHVRQGRGGAGGRPRPTSRRSVHLRPARTPVPYWRSTANRRGCTSWVKRSSRARASRRSVPTSSFSTAPAGAGSAVAAGAGGCGQRRSSHADLHARGQYVDGAQCGRRADGSPADGFRRRRRCRRPACHRTRPDLRHSRSSDAWQGVSAVNKGKRCRPLQRCPVE